MKKPIEIFVRHCNFSSNSIGKNRPVGFERWVCYEDLINDTDKKKVNITVLFDGKIDEKHFINGYIVPNNVKIIEMEGGGDDARSFLNLINYIEQQQFDDDQIIYILEDDYKHMPGWEDVMIDGFQTLNPDYLTLYDHNDKYTLPMYQGLQSQIFVSKLCHWRTTPSTTNTYACRFSTFKKHISIHKQFCDLGKGYTRDHDKFLHLWQNGSNLISSIPGYSTHCEVEYMSPIVEWNF